MTITNVVLQFGGQWIRNEDNKFEWSPQPTTEWQAISVDDATCTIEDVKDEIVKAMELTHHNLKWTLSHMPHVLHCNPRPIYIINEAGLRAYFGFGGPEVRPLLHVGVEHDEDAIIVEDVDGLNDVTDSIDNQISAHDESDEIQPCDGYFYSVPILDGQNKIIEDRNSECLGVEDEQRGLQNIASCHLEKDRYDEVACEDRDMRVVNDDTHSFTNGSNLYVGQEFSSKEDVKNELLKVAIKSSFEFNVQNSNKTIYVVRCVNDKCTWRVRAAKNKDSSVFSIRSCCNTHTCDISHRRGKRRHGSSSMVLSMLLENFTEGKEIPSLKTIVTMMQNRGVDITLYMAWRGKNLAVKALVDKRFCTTGLPSDVVVEVGEMSFHLHKFPLLSKSGVMERLIAESSEREEDCVIKLHDIPGGAKTFELVAKYCYGVKLELTASNVVYLRCASEHLEMTEDYGEGNLISQTEIFLNQVVLRNWKDSLKALETCEDVLSFAEQLHIPKRCIDSLAAKACTDPNLFGWPMMDRGGPMQSPGGSVLWNGISTGARPKHSSTDWWYEDASTLCLPLYKRLISAMESRGVNQEVIAGSLVCYANKYLPALNRRKISGESSNRLVSMGSMTLLSEEEQKNLLEEIDNLLPMQKGLVPTKFLFGLLRTAKILEAKSSCILNLEKRIGLQLDQASLEDLLMPTFSHSMEMLYDVDCVQRILEHFLEMDQANAGDASPGSFGDGQLIGSPSLTPITMVAKLIDGYLAEVAPDVNMKLPKFQSLASAVPEYARPLDDGLYRAIDIYLKSHPWLVESDREQLCRLMDCQKLSLEACTHAAQNERLPLRIIVQVLFFEQLQLRTSIAGCFLVSENLDGSRQLRSGMMGPNEGGGWTTAVRENQVLKVGMDNMRIRVSELERECSDMRQEIEKLGKAKEISSTWGSVSKKFGFKLKSHQICSAQEESVRKQNNGDAKIDQKAKLKHERKKKITLEE